MSAYPFIEAEKAESRNVAKTCELMEVCRSASCQSQRHQLARREIDDQTLGERIAAIHKASRGTYGCPRVHAQLRREGYHVSRKRVARIMAARGLAGVARSWKRTTIADPEAQAAVDLIKRAFGPGSVEVDRVHVGDITYLRT